MYIFFSCGNRDTCILHLYFEANIQRSLGCDFFSVIPIVSMHALDFWQLSFVVFLPFYFQSIVYLNLRRNFNLLTSMTFVAALHGFSNLLSIILINI